MPLNPPPNKSQTPQKYNSQIDWMRPCVTSKRQKPIKILPLPDETNHRPSAVPFGGRRLEAAEWWSTWQAPQWRCGTQHHRPQSSARCGSGSRPLELRPCRAAEHGVLGVHGTNSLDKKCRRQKVWKTAPIFPHFLLPYFFVQYTFPTPCGGATLKGSHISQTIRQGCSLICKNNDFGVSWNLKQRIMTKTTRVLLDQFLWNRQKY